MTKYLIIQGYIAFSDIIQEIKTVYLLNIRILLLIYWNKIHYI